MIRILIFLLKLGVLVTAAVWLALRPGSVTINWQGYEASMSLAVLLLGVAVIALVAVGVHSLWRALVSIPQSLSLGSLSRRQRKGYLALTQGLVAIAAGDAAAARRLAHKADKLLKEPSLTLLLQAQAAQLAGDDAASSRYFAEMVARPDTSVPGLRGLLAQAQARGDTAQALVLARRAQKMQPKADWVLTALVDLEARQEQWDGALSALSSALKQGAIAPDRGRQIRAALVVAQSLASEQRGGEMEPSLRLAKRAYDLVPTSAPIALHYVRLLLKTDRARLAAKIIERVWRTTPHPDLAKYYAEAGGLISATAQVKRFERLVSFNPTAPESHLALAGTALKAQLWGIARAQLEAALAQDPSGLACRLMAEVEEKEAGNQRVARDWLARAADAPSEAGWQCDSCHRVTGEWHPLCPACGGVARIMWQKKAVLTSQVMPVNQGDLKYLSAR